MRRLLGDGRPPRARRVRRDRVDGDQLLPGAGRVARRPGGRHLRGARLARRPAPGPARDGGARRLAVRLLHARLRLQHGRRVLPLRPRGHQRLRAPRRHYHGDNGFDLHAVSGNLCRCTGYRPIKDAAYALAFPASDDELAARRTAPAPPPMATQLHDGEAAFLRPVDLAEALQLLHDHEDATVVAGSTDWGVDVNLKGARAGLVVAVDRLPELRGFAVSDDRGPDRRRPHAHRGRAPARRPAAAAAGADAAVRLAADPQRRHPRRQPRHRLADRRRPAGAARPRGVGRAGLDRGGAHGRRWRTTSPATASPYAARAS